MIYKSYIIEQNINAFKNNIILFYGENLGMKNDFKDQIKKANNKIFIKKISQEEILANKSIFFSEILNESLFEAKKIFFIDQASDKLLEVIKEIEKDLDTQKIFIFSEILEKKSKLRNYFERSNKLDIVACYLDNDLTIRKIIQEKLKGYTGMSQQILNIIVENCKLDRSKLNNEIDKITSFFTNKIIEKEKLELLLNITVNDNFNNLKDEALNGNKLKTNELISDTVLEVEKNSLYLSLINQRLIKLAEIQEKNKQDNFEIALNSIKPPIFWKDKPAFLTQSKKWNKKKIRKILNESQRVELRIKSDSHVDGSVLIKKLIVDICNLANA